ncbi:hypothetical protein N2152v2_005973 [Parachlorella kessleri]
MLQEVEASFKWSIAYCVSRQPVDLPITEVTCMERGEVHMKCQHGLDGARRRAELRGFSPSAACLNSSFRVARDGEGAFRLSVPAMTAAAAELEAVRMGLPPGDPQSSQPRLVTRYNLDLTEWVDHLELERVVWKGTGSALTQAELLELGAEHGVGEEAAVADDVAAEADQDCSLRSVLQHLADLDQLRRRLAEEQHRSQAVVDGQLLLARELDAHQGTCVTLHACHDERIAVVEARQAELSCTQDCHSVKISQYADKFRALSLRTGVLLPHGQVAVQEGMGAGSSSPRQQQQQQQQQQAGEFCKKRRQDQVTDFLVTAGVGQAACMAGGKTHQVDQPARQQGGQGCGEDQPVPERQPRMQRAKPTAPHPSPAQAHSYSEGLEAAIITTAAAAAAGAAACCTTADAPNAYAASDSAFLAGERAEEDELDFLTMDLDLGSLDGDDDFEELLRALAPDEGLVYSQATVPPNNPQPSAASRAMPTAEQKRMILGGLLVRHHGQQLHQGSSATPASPAGAPVGATPANPPASGGALAQLLSRSGVRPGQQPERAVGPAQGACWASKAPYQQMSMAPLAPASRDGRLLGQLLRRAPAAGDGHASAASAAAETTSAAALSVGAAGSGSSGSAAAAAAEHALVEQLLLEALSATQGCNKATLVDFVDHRMNAVGTEGKLRLYNLVRDSIVSGVETNARSTLARSG